MPLAVVGPGSAEVNNLHVLLRRLKQRADLPAEIDLGAESGGGNQFRETIGQGKSKEKVVRSRS
jgi:hypothetical protein